MTRRTITRLVDDVDGSQATQTVSFALDGKTYEIDLNDRNATELRDALAPYISVATETSTRRRRAASGSSASSTASSTKADRQRLADIRAWAHENGHHVSGRGRIPRHIVEAYDAAHA